MRSDSRHKTAKHSPILPDIAGDAENLPPSEEEVCAEGGHDLIIGHEARSCWCGQRVEESKNLPSDQWAKAKDSSTLVASVTTPGVDMRARVRWEAKWLLICALTLLVSVCLMALGLHRDVDVLAILAGSVAFVAFCFTGLSALDTATAWRHRHEIFDSSDIEFLTKTQASTPSRRNQHH